MTTERRKYLKEIKRKKRMIILFQLMIFIVFIFLWEYLSNKNYIDSFIFSSPSSIIKTIYNLYCNGSLMHHINVTLSEVIISFILSSFLGLFIATILWWNDTLAKVIDPYLTILNSLPKVALGPIILIWFGANKISIIVMALLISLIVTTLTIYQGFNSINNNQYKLMLTFKANKYKIYKYLILPSNLKLIISSFKLNISMCLIGLLPPVGEKIFFNKCYSRYLFHYHLL